MRTKPKLLPFKLFLETFKYAPRIAISLVIENKKGEVLLARRNIVPSVGAWHMPGGFILKGEPIEHCIKRLVKKEVGVTVKPSSAVLLGLFENLYGDPRGHIVDAIYRLKIAKAPASTKENKELAFFKEMPKKIGFTHGKTLRKLGYK